MKQFIRSSNAPALFFCLSATFTTTTTAFVPRIPTPQVPNTALHYIKEGYDTGIGPDFLKKQKVTTRPSPFVEDTVNNNDDAVIVDAVVVEEDYQVRSSPKRSSYNAVTVDDVIENTKRQLYQNNPSDLFPDTHQETTPPPSVFDTTTSKTIQGGSLRTWSMEVPEVDHAQVLLKNFDGNPLHAQIDVWDGPDRAPMKLAVYCSNTVDNPFSCIIPTPGISKQSIGIKNAGPLEFPIEAVVIADVEAVKAQREHQKQQQQEEQPNPRCYSNQHQQSMNGVGFYDSIGPNAPDVTRPPPKPKPTVGFGLFSESLRSLGDMRRIEGSSPVDYATHGKAHNEETFSFERNVDSVQVLIETNGLACQARIEVTYDRNHNNQYCDDEIQQVVELQIEDGKERPFFAVIETPMKCPSKVRVVNLDPYSAFPITACVEPYTIGEDRDENETENDFHHRRRANDLGIIDASIEEDEDYYYENDEAQHQDAYFSVPDITIPATEADYDFDEDFFFASWKARNQSHYHILGMDGYHNATTNSTGNTLFARSGKIWNLVACNKKQHSSTRYSSYYYHHYKKATIPLSRLLFLEESEASHHPC